MKKCLTDVLEDELKVSDLVLLACKPSTEILIVAIKMKKFL